MDSERFDRLVRSFGQSRSRRQTLRGLAGLAAVGALARGGQEAAAGKRIGGSPCTKGRQCQTGRCAGEPGQKVCGCSARQSACLQPDNPCRFASCDTTTKTCEPRNQDNDRTCTTDTCQESTCTCQNGTCTSRVTPCDAQSCPGCCDGTTCKGGGGDDACGSNGEGCVSCDAGQRCTGGACVCDATSCSTGCCQNDHCKIDNDGACGTEGGACSACEAGQRCVNGACVCDETSCSTGCCKNNQCQGGTDGSACGAGGAVCEVCQAGQVCSNGSCVCNETSCLNGCCQNNQCKVGFKNCPFGGVCLECCENADCPSRVCRNDGTCEPRTCPANANSCSSQESCGRTSTGKQCFCFQRVDGSGSICVATRFQVGCFEDAECRDGGSPTLVCVRDKPVAEGFCNGAFGLCALPCD